MIHKINIGTETIYFKSPRKYQTIIFPSARDIISAAIKKTSKNNIYTYIIRVNPDFATQISFKTMKEAIIYIEKEYNNQEVFPHVWEMQKNEKSIYCNGKSD